jgi:hypothetical protein
MYAFFPIASVIGRDLSNSLLNVLNFLYLSMLRYYVIVPDTYRDPLQNDLRWLLRRGSPLPIPNREVKPACADGTAICGRVCRRLSLVPLV